MNATEQRTHRTVTQSLEQRLADLEVIVDTLSTNNGVLYAMCETLENRLSGLDGVVASQVPLLQINGGLGSLQGVHDNIVEQKAHCRVIAEKYYIRFKDIEQTTDKLTRGFMGRLRWLLLGT